MPKFVRSGRDLRCCDEHRGHFHPGLILQGCLADAKTATLAHSIARASEQEGLYIIHDFDNQSLSGSSAGPGDMWRYDESW